MFPLSKYPIEQLHVGGFDLVKLHIVQLLLVPLQDKH